MLKHFVGKAPARFCATVLLVLGIGLTMYAQDTDPKKKDEPTKDEPKKVEPKKDDTKGKAIEPKKEEPKKEEPKKVEPKKEEPKKVEPKKEEPKKEEPKKEEPKKVEPKKEEPKKSVEPKEDAKGELTTANIQATVKAYLADGKAMKPLEKLVRAKMKDARGVAYTPEGEGAFTWQYIPAVATVNDADKKTIEKTLQDALTAAIEGEKDLKRKLKPDDMKKAVAAAKKATITAAPFSKIDDLAGDVLKGWVKKYVAKNPTTFDNIKDYVNIDKLKDVSRLSYDPEAASPKTAIVWSYDVLKGATLSDAVKTTIKDTLVAVLYNTYIAYAADEKFPESDAAIFNGHIFNGSYAANEALLGLQSSEVTQDTVRAAVRAYLTNNKLLPNDLEKIGVSADAPSDRDNLVNGLTFTRDEMGGVKGFEWTWRAAAGKAKFSPEELTAIENKLREVLGEAVLSGGGNAALRLTERDYNDDFKSPIREAKITKYDKPYGFDDVKTDNLQARVVNYIANNPTEVSSLNGKVNLSFVKKALDLTLTKEMTFIWEVDTVTSRDKDLTGEEVDAVIKVLKAIVYNALADKTDPTRSLSADELKKVTAAIEKSKFSVNKLMVSKETEKEKAERLRRQEEEEARREREIELERRVTALEEQVAELRRQMAGNSGGRYRIEYVETRTGCFGCKRTLTPVCVPVK